MVDQRCAQIRAANRPSTIGLYLFAGVFAVTLIAGLAFVVSGNPGSGVLFFVLAGIGCLGALYHLKLRLTAAREAELDVGRFRQRIGDAQAGASTREQQWRTELDAIRRLAGEARQRLGSSRVLT